MEINGVYNVIDVCRHIINYCNNKNIDIDNLKLQKLLYFVQAGYLLEQSGKKACFKEDVFAWAYGPVVPEAYRAFKHYGGGNIPSIEQYYIFDEATSQIQLVDYTDKDIADEDKRLIDRILDSLAPKSSIELVKITHMQTPWKSVYAPGVSDIKIPKVSIFRYFNSKK